MSKSSLLSDQELSHLSQVVGQVERQTAGELRLILVERSTRAPYIQPLLFFALNTVFVSGAWVFRYELTLSSPWLVPVLLVALLLAGSLSYVLAKIPWIERALTMDVHRQVHERAELEFYREGLTHTSHRTGILIFLSVFEHRAVVLADEGIAAKVPPETWVNVVNLVLEGRKDGSWAQSLERAIKKCGELLAHHVPIQSGDKNELPNHVIVKVN